MSGIMVVVVLIDVLISNLVKGIMVINKIMNGIDFKILMIGFNIWCNIVFDYILFFLVIINKMLRGIFIKVLIISDIVIIYNVLYRVCNNWDEFKFELNIFI